jgi:hypothetical protein
MKPGHKSRNYNPITFESDLTYILHSAGLAKKCMDYAERVSRLREHITEFSPDEIVSALESAGEMVRQRIYQQVSKEITKAINEPFK